MKLKFSLLITVLFFASWASAQDQIFKKDNAKLEVKVLEVNPVEIKYKLKSNPDGPLYVINKNEVALIIYANGEHETFADAKPPHQPVIYVEQTHQFNYDSIKSRKNREIEKNYVEVTKRKNSVFINSLSFANSCISITAVREFGKGLFSIQLPISFSFVEPAITNLLIYDYTGSYGIHEYKITQKAFDIGLGVYFHTRGRRAITHFIGPVFRFAQFNGYFKASDYYKDPYYGYYNYYQNPRKHGFVMNETYCMINNGFLFRLTPRFNLMIHAAVGFIAKRTYIANDPSNYMPSGSAFSGYEYNSIYNNPPVVQVGFHAGYRF